MDNEARIRQQAYEIWEREGRPEGHQEEHWAQASREIVAESRDVAAKVHGDSATLTAPSTGGATARKAAATAAVVGAPQRWVEQSGRSTSGVATNLWDSALAWFDLMLNFQQELQRASLQWLSFYPPPKGTRISGHLPQVGTAGVQILLGGEERLNVATQTLQGKTTRIRRRVVSQLVEQEVTLRDEKVIVERCPSSAPDAKNGVLIETIIETSDSHQVPTVWKSVHVAGEVVLRKEVTERGETVRDTVRRNVMEVEHDCGTAVR
jgi:hypothetical protein